MNLSLLLRNHLDATMLSGSNLKYTYHYNRSVIVETIRLNGPISRKEIAAATKLTNPTISMITQKLIEEEIIHATGKRIGGKGPRATELELNPDGGFAYGIAIGGKAFLAVLVDLNGQIRNSIKVDLEGNTRKTTQLGLGFPSQEKAYELILSLTKKLTKAQHVPSSKTMGMGIALPSRYNRARFSGIKPSEYPDWGELLLKEKLEKEFQFPVYFEKHATSSALGERFFGKGKNTQNFFFIHLGSVVSGSAIINGQPFRGTNEDNSEFGHLVIESEGKTCFCCGQGCLDTYISIHALEDYLKEKEVSISCLEELDNLLKEKNPHFLKWLDRSALYLSRVLINLERLLVPEAIIFGGLLPDHVLDYLVEKVSREVQSKRVYHFQQDPVYLRGTNKQDTTAQGAGILPIFDSISPQHDMLLKK